MIWNEKIECCSRDEMHALQLERIKKIIQYAYDNVPYTREKLDNAGISPSDIKSFEDYEKVPFTTKEDMRQNFPYGLFAVPMKQIVRIHASSGTTGKPTVVGYTRNDLDMWSENIARLAAAAGANDEDIAQISFGYGLFTGAFGLHYGLEKMGVSVIPISSGNTERQINTMRDFGTTLLISTPSYAMYMAEMIEQMGIKKGALKLRLGMFGGEGMTESMRSEIESRMGILATQNYGLSEIIGPGVSGECIYKCGQHINEDHFYLEIIDSETGEVLPEGSVGELVITTLTKEGLPMLRYRTKDITRLIYEKCACGRTTARHENIKGRCDDMLIIRGVNVFPSQIENVLVGMEGIGPHYEIIVRRENYLDTIEILVELNDAKYLESFSELTKLENKIKHALRTVLNIDAKVKLAEPNTLKRFEGKAKRVTDLRNLLEEKK